MKIIENSKVRNIYISLNYYCDNKCLMCGVPYSKHNKYNEDLSFYISELRKVPFEINREDIVTLSGGEPFLFKELFQLINFIKKTYGCRITIFTNGRALKNQEHINNLISFEVDKLVIPFFSQKKSTYDFLAGANGAYDDVIEGLKNLNDTSIYHEVKFLPMKANCKDIKESYLFIKNNFSHTKFTICGVQYFGEAVNNCDVIGIKYVDLKKELENTLDEALLYYNELIPLYRFPMCILDAEYNNNGIITLYMEYIIGPDYSDVNMFNEDKKKFEVPKPCENCFCFCNWYSEKYEIIFGSQELKSLGVFM